jgi:hypothetical protein
MTIRNPIAYVASLWDWSFLDDCFGVTRIKVSDLDGFAASNDDHVEQKQGHVHRNGHWIVFETKGYGVPITEGQFISHRDMARVGFTVVYLWGPANKPTAMQVWYEGLDHPQPVQEPVSLDDIHNLVRRWFVYANAHDALMAGAA